jgi:hypothetical protein
MKNLPTNPGILLRLQKFRGRKVDEKTSLMQSQTLRLQQMPADGSRQDQPDAHLFLVESCDQTRIRDVMETRGGIDTRDPQRTEFPFLRTSVTIGVRACLVDVVFGNGMDLTPGAPVSFGLREEFFSAPMGCNLVL